MKFFWNGAGHVRYLLDVRSLQKEHLNRREDYFLIHILFKFSVTMMKIEMSLTSQSLIAIKDVAVQKSTSWTFFANKYSQFSICWRLCIAWRVYSLDKCIGEKRHQLKTTIFTPAQCHPHRCDRDAKTSKNED